MEFHVNQQRIHIPLIIESVQVTDLGTNSKLVISGTSLFSIRGNFTHVPSGRNNHVILRTSIHGTESIESYNPLNNFWHGAMRSQSLHGYLPINVTFGFQEKLYFSYNTPIEKLKAGLTGHVRTVTNIVSPQMISKLHLICPNCVDLYTVRRSLQKEMRTTNLLEIKASELGGLFGIKIFDCEERISSEGLTLTNIFSWHQSNYQIWPLFESILIGLHIFDYICYVPPIASCGVEAFIEPLDTLPFEIKFEYLKTEKYHMLSLTRHSMNKMESFEHWNIAIAYGVTSWISDTLKIKASKSVPGEKVLKICLEVERETPWDWDFLSIKPSDPSAVKLNLVWGMADSAKGTCSGTSLLINVIGEISNEQIIESKKNVWPYNDCRTQAKNKTFIPYTDACYEASREMSTFRKYKISIIHKNLPLQFLKLGWKLKALYELVGGNYKNQNSDQVTILMTFPKNSISGEILVNGEKIPTFYDHNFINNILVRSRLHKYMDNIILRSFFSTCILTLDKIRSSSNISHTINKKAEKLILARCDKKSPQFALSAIAKNDFIEIIFNDEADKIILSSDKENVAIYNHTNLISLSRNFEFAYIGSKWARMDKKTIDFIVPDIFLFIHWSQDQVLLFYPNFIQEFVCGYCTLENTNTDDFYEKYKQ